MMSPLPTCSTFFIRGPTTTVSKEAIYDDDDDGFRVAPISLSKKQRKAAASSSSSTPAAASTTGYVALLMNAKVYIIADKFDIQPLKELAKTNYEEVVAHEWNSESLISSLKLLYDETMDTDCLLKGVAIKATGEDAEELMDRGEFVSLCKESGEIAFDVLKPSLSSTTLQKKFPNCSKKVTRQQARD
jgi:hypothetical protein